MAGHPVARLKQFKPLDSRQDECSKHWLQNSTMPNLLSLFFRLPVSSISSDSRPPQGLGVQSWPTQRKPNA